MKFIAKWLKSCQVCKVEFEGHGKAKFCPDCAYKRRIEQNRLWKEKKGVKND